MKYEEKTRNSINDSVLVLLCRNLVSYKQYNN